MRLDNVTVRKITDEISIHAPTRGATAPVSPINPNDFISIHAPTRGATITMFKMSAILYQFQFTHLHEVRRIPKRDTVWSVLISIHAPTRGATGVTATPDRGDIFQFTHLHEVRRYNIDIR